MPPALFGLDLLPGLLWGNLPSSKLQPVPREIGITAAPQSGSVWANERGGWKQPVPTVCSSTSTHGQSALCPGSCPHFTRGRHLPKNKVVMKRELLMRRIAARTFFDQFQALFGFSQGLLFQPRISPSAWVPWCNVTVPRAIHPESLVSLMTLTPLGPG